MAKITDYIDKLREQVERMNAHPYKSTAYNSYLGLRYFKDPLCSWDELEELKDKDFNTDEAYDAINRNAEIEKVLDSCKCDVFLFPDRGGFMYLMWN